VIDGRLVREVAGPLAVALIGWALVVWVTAKD
jgi:hypothetical protein